MKRYKKLCLEAGTGITFEVEEKNKGELIIRSKLIFDDEDDYYFKKYVKDAKYQNLPIPKGYKYVYGDVYNGYVIERCSDGSQFVWVPVKFLVPDGTLDGKSFKKKFGRRYYSVRRENADSSNEFYENLTDELLAQIESVRMYGGFYISRFYISRSKDGKPQSVKGCIPWTDITCKDAKKVASTFENNDNVKSHLTFGAEYDSVVSWFLMAKELDLRDLTGEKSYIEISDFGHYHGMEKVSTGGNEQWCIKNIYDFQGNVREWTQERWTYLSQKSEFHDSYIARGGSYFKPEFCIERDSLKGEYKDVGFRIVLWIK